MIKYEIIVADDRVETIIPIAKFRFLPMNQLVIKVFCVKKTGTFTKAKIQLLTIIKSCINKQQHFLFKLLHLIQVY